MAPLESVSIDAASDKVVGRQSTACDYCGFGGSWRTGNEQIPPRLKKKKEEEEEEEDSQFAPLN
jgi:hypothetical protein